MRMCFETELRISGNISAVKKHVRSVRYIGDVQTSSESGRPVRQHQVFAVRDARAVAHVVAPGQLDDGQGKSVADQCAQRPVITCLIAE